MSESSPFADILLSRIQFLTKVKPIQDLVGLDGLGKVLDQLVKLLLVDSHRPSSIARIPTESTPLAVPGLRGPPGPTRAGTKPRPYESIPRPSPLFSRSG